MLPSDIRPEQFKAYPTEARRLATEYLKTLQRLPLAFLPSLLREVIDYDFKFPAERTALQKELANLESFSSLQREEWFREFAQLHISPELEHSDWIGAPAQFVEQLSAYLWTTHQLDAFRAAALAYADRLSKAIPVEAPSLPRFGITIIGRGIDSYDRPLFRKLRAHGTYFSRIKAENGLNILLDAVVARANAHPAPYGHWHIDGAEESRLESSITAVSFGKLEPARTALLQKMHSEIEQPGMGPEALRSVLARLRPADIGLGNGDAVLDNFKVKMLTEGSGTQIFSTTFVQWTTREALRRAQPLTLLVRFTPRQRQKPMNELLSANQKQNDLDPYGSLIDADMGAYYNWLNLQRLAGAEQSLFLAWFEGHSNALAIAPSLPRGAESADEISIKDLLSSML